MIALSLTVALSFVFQDPVQREQSPRAVRLVDVDGDGALDRLLFDPDGGLRVALRLSGRQFEEVPQSLPSVPVATDLLATDLDGDGHTDLLLITAGPNMALLGDGTGRFIDATERLGLRDGGAGVSVERLDLDGDGRVDLLLHNRAGDVVFHGTGAGFERDPAMPERPRILGVPSAPRIPVPDAIEPETNAGPRRSKGSPRTPLAVPDSPGTPDASGGALSSSDPGPVVGSAEPLSAGGLFGGMATSVRDMTTGQGVRVDSTPTLGRLLPLGPELFVDPGGDVGLGTLTPAAALHVEGTSSSGLALKVGDGLTVRSDSSFTGVGRALPLFSTEAFGVQSPATTSYGGMYVNTQGAGALPFYGYATGGSARAWTYYNLGSLEWRLWNSGDQVIVANNGDTTIQGDVSQALASAGLVKAAVVVVDNGTAVVGRSFNNLPGGTTITVTEGGVGIYQVSFGANVANRFVQATLGGGNLLTVGEMAVAQLGASVFVNTTNSSGSLADTLSFTLLVY